MSTPASAPVVEVKNVVLKFKGVTAINGATFTVGERELFAIIGPNGAGKTSIFNVLSGVYRPQEGSVRFLGEDLLGRRPHLIAAMGMARTFQNIRNVRSLSVLDNVKVGLQVHESAPIWQTVLLTPGYRTQQARMHDRAMEILDLLHLTQVKDVKADALPYGDQRRLEIACALSLDPQLLLLDEPAAGMNPTETIELMRLIQRVHKELDLTIMLIEHNVHFIMTLCQRIQVLNYGRLIAEGAPSYIRTHPAVLEAYLGKGAADDA